MRILITGGAGFVGSNLAFRYREKYPKADIVVFDNLHRRGSELNLVHFKKRSIHFHHGDIRNLSDLEDIPGNFDVLVEASAEPSVLSGTQGSPRYVLDTNLVGTLHALEFARARVATLLFLSTSRVYSIAPLLAIKLREDKTRFEIDAQQNQQGVSEAGIGENFSTQEARSFYGASKLASELLIQEYAATYKFNAILNRSGVIAGRGQFGKVDQGVFTLWIANHYFGKPLSYTGFGGQGKQVRDLLHPNDLFTLLERQAELAHKFSGSVFNIGGGREISTSLCEWTAAAQKATGKSTAIGSNPKTSSVDIPLYLSDTKKAETAFNWRAILGRDAIAQDIASWIHENEKELRGIFAAD
jgi:CDP-paratose 2-epimerase